MPELDFGPFAELSPTRRDAILAAARVERLAAGERLLTQGETADDCFVLVSGLLRVEAGGTVLALLSPPALVGEMALVERKPRTASVVAESDVTALRIEGAPFRAAVDAEPAFATAVHARVAELAADTFLKKDSPFGDLPGDVLAELSRKLEPMHLDPGAALFREGEASDDLFLLRRGRVEVVRDTPDGERRLATLGAGDFVGETAALTGAPRSATVRAMEPVDAYRLAGTEVRPLVERHAARVHRVADALRVRHRPRTVAHVTALPSPDDPDSVILRNEENAKYLKVSHEAHAILEDLDGERTLRDLVLRHFQRTGEMDPHGVFRTVATLQAGGFATSPTTAEEGGTLDRRARLLDLVLAPRIELANADPLATALFRILRPLATGAGFVLALAVGIVGAMVFVAEVHSLDLNRFGIGGLVVAWVGLVVGGFGHEVAHTLACKAFGSRIGRAGVGLMWFSPLIYVDTTDTWTLPRRQRMLVNAAGPIFNFALAGVAALAARSTQGTWSDVLLWLAGMNYLAVVFNLSPLLEFDGYYALTDISNTPMLRRRALGFVFHDLLRERRLPRGRSEWGLFLFAVGAVVYALALTTFVLVALPSQLRPALGNFLPDGLVTPALVAIALVVLTLTIGPLVDNIVAARGERARLSASGAGSAPS